MSAIALEKFATIRNNEIVPLRDLPVLPYDEFAAVALGQLRNPACHCVNYYAYDDGSHLRFICCIADDSVHTIKVLTHQLTSASPRRLRSLSAEQFQLHIFEREIAENFGIDFIGHPWQKPVRYAWNRADQSKVIDTYPFYKIESDELHEVGVGPIHAGVIEPGHFRFLCNGETVLHLEIQLGWQHRGIETLFLSKPGLLQRTILSESIAGDTAVGHSLAFVSAMESLCHVRIPETLVIERTIALELERLAMHVGDLGNVNVGMAYQLASSVYGTLRTPVINYSQTWCGNRFGKGLNRVGGTYYPFNSELQAKLLALLDKFDASFIPMSDRLFSLPSFLLRAERIGTVSEKQMQLIGAVGMAARMAGVTRDVRQSHPFGAYRQHAIPSRTLEQGDVWARMMLRNLEVQDTIAYLRELTGKLSGSNGQSTQLPMTDTALSPEPDALCVSLVEGWRGEICHCVVTGKNGEIAHYKVKDPSLHNWMALALSLRDLEISDFPINNKSYNLSYCGHDL